MCIRDSLNTGEISGTLARQEAVEQNFSFVIRANRVVATGVNTFTDKTFTSNNFSTACFI
mgnify:CR=1 FL=1